MLVPLQLADFAQSIVTFLPFSEAGVEDLLRLAFRQLSQEVASDPSTLGCGSVIVSDDLVPILACDEHVDYDTHVMSTAAAATGEAAGKVAVLMSTWGARRIVESDESPFVVIKAAIKQVARAAVVTKGLYTVLPREVTVRVDPVPGSLNQVRVTALRPERGVDQSALEEVAATVVTL